MIVTVISVAVAFAGEDVYGLLEASYAVGFVGFFLPVLLGMFSTKLDEKACLISIVVGILVWSPEFFGYENLPYSLLGVLAEVPVYFIAYAYFQKAPGAQ